LEKKLLIVGAYFKIILILDKIKIYSVQILLDKYFKIALKGERCLFIEFFSYFICLSFQMQLLFGKLNIPIESLRIIEESSASPDEMQTNFGYLDECGNPKSITSNVGA